MLNVVFCGCDLWLLERLVTAVRGRGDDRCGLVCGSGGISRAMCFASCPPAFGLLLDLRKAHHPADFASVLARWQGEFKSCLIGGGANECESLTAEILTPTVPGTVIGRCDRALG
jgi:hypothetical protein